MSFMTKLGGEVVSGGTFWSITTGEKVTMAAGEQLPGTEKEKYSRVPRWMLFSLLPLAALLLVDILPNALKSMYTQLTSQLVFSYVVIVFGFLGLAVAAVMAGLIWDVTAMRELTIFGWQPGEAYFSGSDKKKVDEKRSKARK